MSSSPHTIKGITLIETIVSIALLSIAVVGPMTLAAHSIKVSGAARNELIATHLAEEGIEAIHNMRDNNSAEDNTDRRGSINGYRWMTDVFDNCSSANGCIVDVTAHAAINVWAAPPPPRAITSCPVNCSVRSIVYLNPVTGLYRQAGGTLGSSPWVRTPFRRTIFMVGVDHPVTPERQVRVTAVVTYPGYGGKTRQIRISQDIYNWFPYLP